MAEILRMPNILAGATEATIAVWVLEEGSVIAPGTIIAEIETEKAVVELPAERDGVLGRFLAKAGETVIVGAPIAVVLDFAHEVFDLEALGAKAARPTTAGNAEGTDVEPARAGDQERYFAHRPAEIFEPVTASSETNAKAATSENAMAPSSPATARLNERKFASPLVRRLAREGGFDLEDLTGSGPGGRIVRRDVEADAGTPARTSSPTPTAAPAHANPATIGTAEGTTTPHPAMRRAIARRLTESKTTIPHFYLRASCRVDRLLALRGEINEATPGKISVNDLVVKAVAAAYRAVPQANVVWTDDGLVQFDRVDVAVAISTPRGLVTPVVRDVGATSISQLSATIAELAGRAREGRLRQHELEGGTFTVSNLGMHDIQEFTAIINPPHSGILAVGAARQQAIVDDGSLAVGTVMQVVLSADHRALDGALAARWLHAFVAALEHPLSLLV